MAAEKVSRRIRYYMDQREIDIYKLASLTGLDIEFLDTMLETDILPPLGPLMKIARALGVRLGTFLDDQDSKDPFIVKKAQRNSEINVPAEKGKAESLRFHRGGENIYPKEIEEFLYRMDGISDVQVAAVPSKKYGEEVGAFVIPKQGEDIQESDVRDFCRGKISRYKIPGYVGFVDSFPMTASGKIQKFKLSESAKEFWPEA